MGFFIINNNYNKPIEMNSFNAFDSDSESETVEVTKGVTKVFTQNSKRVKRKERNQIKKATYSIPSRFVGRFIGKKHENRLELLDAIAQDTGCQGWSLNCMSSRLSCNGEFLFLAAEKSTVAQIQRAREIIWTSIDALVNSTTYAASEASDVSDASTIAFEPLKTKKKKKTSKKKTSKKKTSKKKTSKKKTSKKKTSKHWEDDSSDKDKICHHCKKQCKNGVKTVPLTSFGSTFCFPCFEHVKHWKQVNKKNVKNIYTYAPLKVALDDHLHKPTPLKPTKTTLEPLKPRNTIASWADAADEDDTADDEENPNQENPNQENYHFPAL